MKNRIAILGAIALTFTMIGACGGGDGSDATSPTPSASEEELAVTPERPNQPSVGDCFNPPPGEDEGLVQVDEGATSGIEVVPCGSAHDYEVFALSATCNSDEDLSALADHLGISEDSLDPNLMIRVFYDAQWEFLVCAIPSSDASGDSEQTESDSSPASTATPPPAPAASVDFEDQFDGRLEDGWRWSIEDPGTWSLAAAPGWLQITAVELLQNVLLRPAPDADYEVTAAVSFRPTSNFQFAGLVAAPRGGQTVTLLQLGRAYCDPLAIPGICVGDGVYFDKIEDGETVNAFVSEISTDTEVLYLRLLADGDSYSGYFSEDGEIWTLVGNQVASYIDTDIGLIAHQAYEEPAAASFDYLTVTSPPVGDKPPAATDLPGSAPAASSDSDATPAPQGIPPTAQNVESSIGGEATFCGSADAVTERGDGLETVFMGALLLYVEPDAAMPSRWWDREFCVTGTVQPKDERGSAFITVADSQQIE